MTQKHGGETDRGLGCLWRAVGWRPCSVAEGRTPEGAESDQTGEKLRGHPGISGTGIGTMAGAERPTRCIKCRTALCCAHTRPF
nr:MAG TPA: hypothetical protein [Caudoviricetes sp.]